MAAQLSRFVTVLENVWDGRRVRAARSISLVVVLVVGAALIELGGWIWPMGGPQWLPKVHLAAISWAIALLLLYELVEMTFAIAKSVASSVARYLQLYALVLLRDAFLKLESFPEPINVALGDMTNVAVMLADAAGAVLLFVSATIFARFQRHAPITVDAADGERFVAIKRIIVLLLLCVLVTLCMLPVLEAAGLASSVQILETFFTVLVFADVLLAFVSLAFTTNPAIVFRNFGFAFSAIILRLALSSPEFIRPALCVVGAIIAIAMTLAYNLATDVQEDTPVDDVPAFETSGSEKEAV